MRRKIKDGLRYLILRRDGFRCRYCGAHGSETELHVDHVQPVAAGGTNKPLNLVTACKQCNSGKAARVPRWTVCARADDQWDIERHLRNQFELSSYWAWMDLCERDPQPLTEEKCQGLLLLAHDRRARELALFWGSDGVGMQGCEPTGWGRSALCFARICTALLDLDADDQFFQGSFPATAHTCQGDAE
jgi:hypothetical protein